MLSYFQAKDNQKSYREAVLSSTGHWCMCLDTPMNFALYIFKILVAFFIIYFTQQQFN